MRVSRNVASEPSSNIRVADFNDRLLALSHCPTKIPPLFTLPATMRMVRRSSSSDRLCLADVDATVTSQKP